MGIKLYCRSINNRTNLVYQKYINNECVVGTPYYSIYYWHVLHRFAVLVQNNTIKRDIFYHKEYNKRIKLNS